MKKRTFLFVIFVFLLVCISASAQNEADSANSLPQLLDAVPDPAAVLGSAGSVYQDNFVYHGSPYRTYLYPHPDSPETFSALYTQEAAAAGYTVETGNLEGYDVLQIFDKGNRDLTALLFADYQGFAFFMVPAGMQFTLYDQVPEIMQPARLVELGNEAIANQDYQTAVRYLIKAAGSFIQGDVPVSEPVPSETPIPVQEETPAAVPEQQEDRTYVVQEGDSCWSIAAQFGMDVRDFMEANDFTDCNIHIGDEVIIPGEEILPPTPTPLPGAQRTYVVEAGDNCWAIAVDKFGVNFELFMAINNMTECSIQVGDEVIIPGTDEQMPTMTPILLDQYTTGQQIRYIVEMNDSYNDIAQKFNTTLFSIQQLNNVNVYTGFPQYGQALTIAVNLLTPTPAPEMTATPEPGTIEP